MTSARGQRRRAALLSAVAEDVARNGLVDFSLRRAARAANTTHKVLLYHFDSADDLLQEALGVLREGRLHVADARARADPGTSLGQRMAAAWEALLSDQGGPRVLDQATALGLLDPDRHARLAQAATEHYLPAILELLPAAWTDERREEVGALVLAALRGLLVDALTSDTPARARAGLHALTRLLDTEEQRP